MSSRFVIGRNILANALGGSWVVILSLVAIPFQIRILGAEAFGLIGFLTSLQGFISVLDFGLSTTVNREIAGDASVGRVYSRSLVETAAGTYWAVAAVLGVALAWAAPAISTRWLTLEVMTPSEAAGAIRIMAFWMAFSWPTTLYGSILAGQQRLDVMNALKVGAATLSQGGGLIVVLLWRDFHVFLYWIAAVALLSIIAHVVVCRRFSPWMSLRLRPSTDVIRRIWRFSVDVNLIAILAVVYTQLDRLILSRLLPLRMLGYYNAAYSLTRGIGTVQGFVNSAMLPALSSDFGHGRLDEMKGRYSKFSQGLMYLASLPAFFLLFFGFDVLRYWATPDVADAVSRALQILAAGFLLNAAASAPYVLSIATGETKLPLKVNLLGVGLYIPGLIGLTLIWGVDGAALAWLILNLYYLATLLPLTQRRIMRAGAAAWMRANLAPFLLVGVAAFGLMSWLVGSLGRESMATIAIAGASAVAIHTIGGFFMLGSGLRRDARNLSSLVWQDLTPRRKARRLAEIEGGSDRRSPGPDV